MQLGIVVEKNWTLFDAGCRCFSFWFISSIGWAFFSDVTVLPGFRRLYWIRLAADHQWQWPFFWCKFGLGKCFEVSFQSSHWASHYWLSYEIHILSHITIQLRNALCRIREDISKRLFFFYLRSAHEAPTYQVFHLSNLLQTQNDHRMVDIQFFATSHLVVRGLASMVAVSWSLSTSYGWPLCSSSSRPSSPLQNFLNHHCTVHSLAMQAKCIVDVVSFLHCFTTHFELELRNHWNLLFV